MRTLSGSISALAALLVSSSSLASSWIQLNSNSQSLGIVESTPILTLSSGTLNLSGATINGGSSNFDPATILLRSDLITYSPPIDQTPVLVPTDANSFLGAVTVTCGTLSVDGSLSTGSYSLVSSGSSLSLVKSGSGSLIIIAPPVIDQPVIVFPPADLENHSPIGSNRTIAHSSQSPHAINPSLLATDPDGDILSFVVTQAPAFGSVQVLPNAIVYTPSTQYLEGDTFKVQCNDGRGGTAESTVTLTNRFAQLDGSFSGVLAGRGALFATVDRFGSGTFKIRLDGLTSGGSFTLNPEGPTEISLPISPSAGAQSKLTLDFLSGDLPILRGVVAGIHETATFDCARRSSAEIAAQYAGQYNVELAAPADTMKSPFGFAIVQVKPDGLTRVLGRLPNAKTWSTGSQVNEIGDVPIVVETQGGGELLTGGISLPTVRGSLEWTRPNGAAELRVTGQRFERQGTAGKNVFGSNLTRAYFSLGSPALSKKLITISYVDGFSTTAVARESLPIRIDGQNKSSQLVPAPPLMTLVIKPDGRFSGTYVTPKASQYLHFTGIMQSTGVRGLGVITGGSGGYATIDLTNPGKSDSSGSGLISVGSFPSGAGIQVGSTISTPAGAEQVAIQVPLPPRR